MIKVLFLIHDLGKGGAEKVLINLVNHLDKQKFDVTVMAIFGGGENEKYLNSSVTLINCFNHTIRGNRVLMKLFTPKMLHKYLIHDEYDIEVSYLEGPCARIISACPNTHTKLISWIHCTIKNDSELSRNFRSLNEAKKSYKNFDSHIFVSNSVMESFCSLFDKLSKTYVLYNTNNTREIIEKSKEEIKDINFDKESFKIIGVGKIAAVKGFDRLARIHKKLIDDGYGIHTYILGDGIDKKKIESYCLDNGISDSFTLLGYKSNPYKYVSNCDLYVCSSLSEGFCTATTESLIVGTPVITTDVSGAKEMLGNNEYGLITINSDEELYKGIKSLLDDKKLYSFYATKAKERGKLFSTNVTVKKVEEMLESVYENDRY